MRDEAHRFGITHHRDRRSKSQIVSELSGIKGIGKITEQELLRHFKSVWIGLDCFNLFDISNVSSYYWVTDVNEIQYAVPNYLTRRQINVRLSVNF